jgi:hypothetical protein
MKVLLPLFIMLLAPLAPAAFAQNLDSDQLRGQVQSVDEASRTLRVKVLEAGSGIDARKGSVESYQVPRDADVHYEIDSIVYQPFDGFRLSDIEEGDHVVLEFADTANRSTVTNVRNTDPQNVATRDRIQREGQRVDSDTLQDRRQVADRDRDTSRSERQMASRETTSRRSGLPDSASNLPKLALLGLLFAGLAGTVRLFRS